MSPKPRRDGRKIALPCFTIKPYYVTENATQEHPNGTRRRLLKVKCPRADCRNVFVVPASWKTWGKYRARPCPWCFKAAQIPED